MLRTLSDVASSDQRTTHQGEAVHRRWSFRLLQDLCTEKRKEGKKKKHKANNSTISTVKQKEYSQEKVLLQL